MKSSLSNQRSKAVKARKPPMKNKTKRHAKYTTKRTKKMTKFAVDRKRLIASRTPVKSTTKPTINPYSGQAPNPITKEHMSVALAHGVQLGNANGQSGLFIGAEGGWGTGGGFLAKRDLRTKLRMTNIFYAPGYSSAPTTAQGGAYGYYRGRFHCVGNNLTTPIPGTTHRPFGFDQLAAFYTYYEVHSCRIKLSIQNMSYGGTRGVASPPGPAFACVFPISYDYSVVAGTNPGVPANTGATGDNTLSSAFWSREVLSLQPHVEHSVMTNPSAGKPWCTMEQHWSTSEILGTQTDDEFNFKGACTPVNDTPLQPPTNIWNYVVSMNSIPRSGCGGGGPSGAAAFGPSPYLALCVQVSLEFDVTFFDARLVAPSEAPTITAMRGLSPLPQPRPPVVSQPREDDEKDDSSDTYSLVDTPNPFGL